MREYLFRGKRLDNGEWVEGFLVNVGGYCYILTGLLSIGNGHADFFKYVVDPETVGQYTGLTDKNGKRIFEGDVVQAKTVDTHEYRRTVIGIGLCVESKDDTPCIGVNFDYFGEQVILQVDMMEHLEVIGNIHDNPEMMATEKERRNDPAESFDGGYHLYAEEKYRERVAKTPERIKYAIRQFEENGLNYSLKNEKTGHFHCWRETDNRLFQFYAGTGKIVGRNIRGIRSLVRILKGEL